MRPSRPEPEYAPLLPEGLHPVDETALRQLCLASFPRSRTRGRLFAAMEQLIALLRNSGIAAEVWIDGSFVTRKPDPRDVDVVLFVDWSFAESGTPRQRTVIRDLDDRTPVVPSGLDLFTVIEYPVGHPLHTPSAVPRRYWALEFGHDRDGRPKGILTLTV